MGKLDPKSYIQVILLELKQKWGIDFVKEYKFLEDRKFRFDWFIPELNLAIEYEGIYSAKSRHTSLKGYTNDCTKYNFATKAGYKVLRYTASNYTDLKNDIEQMF